MRKRSAIILSLGTVAVIGAPVQAGGQQASLIIRNNHEIGYSGPVEMPVNLPDGTYQGGSAWAVVSGGRVHSFTSLAPRTEVRLVRTTAPATRPPTQPGFNVRLVGGRLSLAHGSSAIGEIELGLVVIPRTDGNIDSVATRFSPLMMTWTTTTHGAIQGSAQSQGFTIEVNARAFAEGALDSHARVIRSSPASTPAYVSLVRRLVTRGASNARFRFNGREFPGGDSPDTWDRDFWYTHGVDWLTWRAGPVSLISVSGFSPVPTIQRDSVWAEGSHFYVWERTRQRGDTTYLVSEIAGPNPEQAKSRYMPVTPYAPVRQGDTVSLKWRLALDTNPQQHWAESQLRGFAGYRTSEPRGSDVLISLGVPSVKFGTSYFPYSTLAENFDYYRTPGMTSEGFWPMSPTMWAGWRKWIPKMESDLHIARAMGFESVRLHHLELLRTMKRDEAFAFLDFFTARARDLDLTTFIDTEGPAEWVTAVLGRYKNVVDRVEIENEVLIAGIRPSDPARWTALYNAAKAAAPDVEVFLTSAGNHAMFDRIRGMGVPFDRVGLHLYKHGPQWKEAYSSHVLGSAGYASDIGKPVTIGEFNWKDLTRMSPEVRRDEFAKIYEKVLEVRAVPEVMQFQFHETLTFNPAVAGSASRHYEPLYLDRRPKPEAFELMRLIREHGRDNAPVREIPVVAPEIRLAGDRGSAEFSITNATSRTLALTVSAVAFDGIRSRLASPSNLTLAAGATRKVRVALTLAEGKRIGTYHHFLKIDYEGKRAYGWGVAAKEGAPLFSPTALLSDRVRYSQGVGSVATIDWRRPIAVSFGETASVLELESAYQLAATLQSATGKRVRLSSVKDLPDSLITSGIVILVGTSVSNSLVASTPMPHQSLLEPGFGRIWLRHEPGRDLLILTGADAKGVQAAAVDFQLRYWLNAKDAVLRMTGMERGAALGNRAGGPTVDPP